MGSKVTILGRNARFLPKEEPEVSELAERELGRYVKIITNHEVRKVQQTSAGSKKLTAFNNDSGEKSEFFADEILMATGRSPNSTFIHPTRGGIRLDDKGWVVVNDFLETSIPNIWSFGDANGKKLFKHASDYEAHVVYRNAVKESYKHHRHNPGWRYRVVRVQKLRCVIPLIFLVLLPAMGFEIHWILIIIPRIGNGPPRSLS